VYHLERLLAVPDDMIATELNGKIKQELLVAQLML
jgi:hypothetical protein